MFSLRRWVLTRIQKRIVCTMRSTLQRIYPENINGLFNFRCLDNVVQNAFADEENIQVYECLYIDDDGDPILHYLNYDLRDQKYKEVTIGWKSKFFEYYIVKRIEKDDWRYIQQQFNNSLNYWFIKHSNWFERLCIEDKRAC